MLKKEKGQHKGYPKDLAWLLKQGTLCFRFAVNQNSSKITRYVLVNSLLSNVQLHLCADCQRENKCL